MKYTRPGWQVGRWALLALLIGYATVHRLGQTYGSTSLERRTPMPADVDQLDSDRLLVLHSTSHLPLEWRRSGRA